LQADINNYVIESNKGNNITTEAVPVTVTAPELVPGGLGSDATAVSANSLRVAECLFERTVSGTRGIRFG